ncbi:PhzF family phenazine biosynthesis protein [Conexibacter sp. DBS9H8]|uniref:PhzF family phenazine biosynthesis protein n=1 Tax=Conexibacter sp. DBS9H8 TaxID=2937801 RepID=UPI00200F6237|nr:PhzF family phenazine biosynthesis protein [Conexibacter sp. DBS9H8]
MSDADGHPYEIWDVFTDTPLAGNPLAVFPHAEEIPSRFYQPLARELNLSETAFLLPDDPASADAQLRIFTPQTELPFAGHPTLGAAYAIAQRRGAPVVRLRTGAGIIVVRFARDEEGALLSGEMTQPIPTWVAYPEPAALLDALGVEASDLPVELYDNGPRHVVVSLSEREMLARIAPDMGALSRLGAHGVAVIAPGAVRDQIHSRNFCPGLGVPEDAATGSAAGPVAVHLLRHGRLVSAERLEIIQGVELGRPSRLLACAHGDGETVRSVTVAGAAVAVGVGHFRLA